MQAHCFSPFSSTILPGIIPQCLNNPYELAIPAICMVATNELEHFLIDNKASVGHDFGIEAHNHSKSKGKMFGVLVVRDTDGQLGYLSTFSGKLSDEPHHPRFVPSLFDISTDDFFINKGMSELTEMGNHLKLLTDPLEIERLKQERKAKSMVLQQQLFNHYHFYNQKRELKSLCDIFESYNQRKPPAGAGECATPKLLHYAFKHNMIPLAVAEFWWGKETKSGDRQHKQFYPPCNDKCRPILSYMLDGVELTSPLL
jgi:tRNA pseudouridine32 synthase / 23S rRNA pseudouridine746 synthase